MEALIQYESADLVFVTETWFPDRFNPVLPNFNLVATSTRADTYAGHSGGCAIFIKNCNYLHVNYSRAFNPSQDCQTVTAIINNVTYVCVYRSPSQKKENIDKLTAFIRSLQEFPSIVVVGDLNIPTAKWELMSTNEPNHVELVNEFANLNLWNYVEESTHRQGNVLDLILAENNLISSVEVDPESSFKSDHFPVTFTVENLQNERTINEVRRNHDEFDKEKFISLLRGVAWTLINYANVDTAVEQITSILLHNYDVCLPRQEVSTSREYHRFSAETSAQINLCKHLKKTKGHVPCLIAAKAKLAEMIKKDKKVWAERYMKYLAKNRKNIWKVMSKKHFDKRIMCIRRNDSSITYDNKEICTILNSFYASVFLISGKPNFDWDNEDGALMMDIEITREKVSRAIKKTRRSNGPGPDGLSTAMFKDSDDALLTPIEILFRKIIRTGVVPEAFRLACVTPLPKKLDSSYAVNTRGINIESVFGKLLEKIISTEMSQVLEDADYFPDTQWGFRRGRGCEGNLDSYHTFLHQSLEDGYMVATCFADLSKAFDVCDHALVLKAVYDAGIRGTVGKYIEAWLEGRHQYVKFNGETSEKCDVTSSVVQGSNLGPLLFLLLKNDLNDYIKYGVIQDYADDCKISLKYKDRSELWMLQEDISGLYQWSIDKRQKLNSEKTVILNFGGHLDQNILFVNNYPLRVVDEVCDLGLVTNSLMGFKNHHEEIIRKTRIAVNSAKLSTHGADFQTKRYVYVTYIRSIFSWMSHAWRNEYVSKALDQLYANYFEDQKPPESVEPPHPPSVDLLFFDLKKALSIKSKCKSLHEWRMITGDVSHQNSWGQTKSQSTHDRHKFTRATPKCKHSWAVYPLFQRINKDWNLLIQNRVPWTDSGLRQFVISEESSAAGVGLYQRLVSHKLLSKHAKRRRRVEKLKELQLRDSNRIWEVETVTSNTESMSETSSSISVKVLQDDYRSEDDYSFTNGLFRLNGNNNNNDIQDNAGNAGVVENGIVEDHEHANNPPEEVPPPGEDLGPIDIEENARRMRNVALAFLDRVDEGVIARNPLVQQAATQYTNQVGAVRNGGPVAPMHQARTHLLDTATHATTETFNAVQDLHPPIDAATLTALRVAIEAAMQAVATADGSPLY